MRNNVNLEHMMSRLLLGYVLIASVLCAQDGELASRAVSLLEQRCVVCHGAALAQSGLRLNSRESALQGGVRGPAIIPGNASESRVVQAIKRTGDLSMPPGPKLPDAEIATIEKWIAEGAIWPKSTQTWWSFVKPVRPAVPTGKNGWIRTPVDAFIAQKLTENALKPAPEADRRTLIRRA